MAFALTAALKQSEALVDQHIVDEKSFHARLLAESGLVLASHPGVKPGDPILRQWTAVDRKYEVRVIREGGRLCVNQLGNPALNAALQEMLKLRGLDAEQAAILADSLADWVDADDEARPQGAEREFYERRGFQHFPRNTPFTDLNEMQSVRGIEPVLMLWPAWKNFLTVHGNGQIDVNDASPEVLEAVCRASRSDVDRLVRFRNGPDEIALTEDDERLPNMRRFQEIMQMERGALRRVAPLLTFDHPVRRVESRGTVGNVSVTLIEIQDGPRRLRFTQ